MVSQISLRAGSATNMARYVARQLDNMFPADSFEADLAAVEPSVSPALERMRPILAALRIYEPDRFDHFHSLAYASFVYLLSTEVVARGDAVMGDRLFCLNRALNAIDLYHAVKLGEVFGIGHSLGTVLGNAVYGTKIIICQNVTVGRVADNRPTLGDRVLLYPGCSVTGRSNVGDNCVISAGVAVHNMDVPSNTLVTQKAGEVVLQPLERDFIGLFLRD
jgi:serine O-acetyltransferase